MAIYRPSALVQSISGSVGGVTFAPGPRGHIAKHRPARINKHAKTIVVEEGGSSPITWTVGQILQIKSNAWRDLPQDTRSAWHSAAAQLPTTNRLGTRRTITGRQLFFKLTFIRDLAASSPLLGQQPPVLQHWPSKQSYDLSNVKISNSTWTINPKADTTQQVLWECRISRPYSDQPSIAPRNSRLVHIETGPGDGSAVLRPFFERIFGEPVLNEYLQFRFTVTLLNTAKDRLESLPSPPTIQSLNIPA